MSTPPETGPVEGENPTPEPVPADPVAPAEDPVMTPVTDVTVDESGNTTVVGYPPSTNEVYTEQPSVDPGGVGALPDGGGIGSVPDGGGSWG
ncbi:hypothetical protein HOS59_gp16 [Streptomyces phage Rowa]|uniref:Uncharacterized protein n=1 Tax=Streptomyces phage Rowa TaxID=2059883 RepID=A0A2H5BLR7_9CAUD|nr:hypothetical protein HOS59_gp16 [Streptomyces phage Rowa]AUG87280.1 hypothetical protein SEA_ROWA_16 [Streptomyces phage Rowa]